MNDGQDLVLNAATLDKSTGTKMSPAAFSMFSQTVRLTLDTDTSDALERFKARSTAASISVGHRWGARLE